MYPAYYKSLLIKNINKNDEWVGSLTLNLQEAGKDITQEQFNHIVRLLINKAIFYNILNYFMYQLTKRKGLNIHLY
jgi:hypothetical protein